MPRCWANQSMRDLQGSIQRTARGRLRLAKGTRVRRPLAYCSPCRRPLGSRRRGVRCGSTFVLSGLVCSSWFLRSPTMGYRQCGLLVTGGVGSGWPACLTPSVLQSGVVGWHALVKAAIQSLPRIVAVHAMRLLHHSHGERVARYDFPEFLPVDVAQLIAGSEQSLPAQFAERLAGQRSDYDLGSRTRRWRRNGDKRRVFGGVHFFGWLSGFVAAIPSPFLSSMFCKSIHSPAATTDNRRNKKGGLRRENHAAHFLAFRSACSAVLS